MKSLCHIAEYRCPEWVPRSLHASCRTSGMVVGGVAQIYSRCGTTNYIIGSLQKSSSPPVGLQSPRQCSKRGNYFRLPAGGRGGPEKRSIVSAGGQCGGGGGGAMGTRSRKTRKHPRTGRVPSICGVLQNTHTFGILAVRTRIDC